MLRRFIKKKAVTKEQWEGQYSSGGWSFLNTIHEAAHYSIITGYLDYFKKHDLILDVGCGEGVLQQRIQNIGYKKYVGIDFSLEAINKAKLRENNQTVFIQTQAEEFNSEKNSFDAIIFNEVLYYLESPLEVVKKYEQFLQPGGILIISMCVHRKSSFIWKKLDNHYSFIDETKVINKKGNSWIVKCCLKK